MIGIASMMLIAAQVADPAKDFADPLAAIQGEWVSRFCSKTFKWKVEGATVTMAAHGTTEADVYANRYPEGAPILTIGEVAKKTETMVQWRTTDFEPDGSKDQYPGYAAVTFTPKMAGAPVPYYTFQEMWRPAVKAKLCT